MTNKDKSELGQLNKLPMDGDSMDESVLDLKLFEAYRKGELDLDILNSQPKCPVISSTSTSSTVNPAVTPRTAVTESMSQPIPKSWCMSKPNNRDLKVVDAVGQNIRPNLKFRSESSAIINTSTMVTDIQAASITRVPVTSANITHSPNKGSRDIGAVNSLLVNQRQRGNPILKHIRNVAWEYSDIEPDYVVGRHNCVYFLSMRYHNLNAEYIYERLRQTKQKYQLSVLLVQVDVTDPYYTLKELCKLCWSEGLTLMLAWTPEEAARYLESYKALENKPPDLLMPESASSTDHAAQITEFLTSVKRITKTDAITAATKFGTIADLIKTNRLSLEKCPGFGQLKARKLHDVFHMPFLRSPNS